MRMIAVALLSAAVLVGGCANEVTETDLSKGLAAIKEGRLPAAEQHFNTILAKDPNDAYANLNLGMVKAKTGRRDEAAAHYRLAEANGGDTEVQSLVRPGSSDAEPFQGTVADVARRNLANLGV